MDVGLLGTAMTKQGQLAETASQLARDACDAALADAGVDARQIGLLVGANALGGLLCDQGSIRFQAWLQGTELASIPTINVENACAAGAAALYVGCLAVEAGQGPVLVAGVEKMWTGSRRATLEGIEGCLPSEERPWLREQLPDASGSIFMGLNAAWANRLIDEGRATTEHFAAAATKARRHGSLNPLAQFREPVTMEEVLASPIVAGPLTRLMCSSFTDGGAAVVIGKTDDVNVPRILSSVLLSGDGTVEYHDRLSALAELAWKASGLGPDDIDVVENHDATSAEELFAVEALGFFAPGEAGPQTLRGGTTFGGRVVVNPSGGLVARGHAIGATGLCQVHELTEQLRGRAGDRQVEGVRTAMAVNTGGIVGGQDVASGVAHILVQGS